MRQLPPASVRPAKPAHAGASSPVPWDRLGAAIGGCRPGRWPFDADDWTTFQRIEPLVARAGWWRPRCLLWTSSVLLPLPFILDQGRRTAGHDDPAAAHHLGLPDWGRPGWDSAVLTPLIRWRREKPKRREGTPASDAGRQAPTPLAAVQSLRPAWPGKPVPALASPAAPGATAEMGDQDPLRREIRSSAHCDRPSATVRGSMDTGSGAASRVQDPMRHEGSTVGEAAGSVPRSDAVCLQDPIQRERAAVSAPHPRTLDPLSATPAASALAAAVPGNAEDPVRRESEAPSPRSGPLRNGNPRGNPNLAPRCGARTRQGCPCKGPAMRNGRCRMHGGKSTGPRTAEGLARLRAAARARHGGEAAAEARAFARSCRVLIRDTRALLALAKRPAGNRPALDPEKLFDALMPVPQAGLPPGPTQPPSEQTGGRRPCTVRTVLPDPPCGPGDLATAGLGFHAFTVLRPAHPLLQDPMRREGQPLRQLPAPHLVLPALARTPDHRPLPGRHANTVTGVDRRQEAYAP